MKPTVAIFLWFSILAAQQPAGPQPAPKITFGPLTPRPDGKSRIFVGESETFYSSSFYSANASGSANATAAKSSGGAFGMSSAGVLRFTIDVMKNIKQICPEKTVIVSNPDSADYFVRVDVEGGPFLFRSKMVAFGRDGEMSFVHESVSMKKDVQGFCKSLPDGPLPAMKTKK